MHKSSHHAKLIFFLLMSQTIGSDILQRFQCCSFQFTYLSFRFYAVCYLSNFRTNRHNLCDFSVTFPGKLILQIYKSSAILIHCLEEIFYDTKVFEMKRRYINVFTVDLWSIHYTLVSWKKRLSLAPLFFDVMMFSVFTKALTQQATKSCVVKLQTKSESNGI